MDNPTLKKLIIGVVAIILAFAALAFVIPVLIAILKIVIKLALLIAIAWAIVYFGKKLSSR